MGSIDLLTLALAMALMQFIFFPSTVAHWTMGRLSGPKVICLAFNLHLILGPSADLRRY